MVMGGEQRAGGRLWLPVKMAERAQTTGRADAGCGGHSPCLPESSPWDVQMVRGHGAGTLSYFVIALLKRAC